MGLSVVVIFIAKGYDIYQGRSFVGFPFLFFCDLQLLLDDSILCANFKGNKFGMP